jgi:hypothetical protein
MKVLPPLNTTFTLDPRSLRQLQFTVIVAVITVWMMQATIHEIIHMVAVRDRFVAAPGSVNMCGIVAGARSGVTIGIDLADFDHVLIDMPSVRMMQMPVMQIIDVPIVFHRDVAAIAAVLMFVASMNFAVAHNNGGLNLRNHPLNAAQGQDGILFSRFA